MRIGDDERWRRAALAALVAFAVLRLAALTRYPPWTDEVWTMNLVRGSLEKTLRIQADDQTQPPLFYALFWGWRHLGGGSLAWLRLLPAAVTVGRLVQGEEKVPYDRLAAAIAANTPPSALWPAVYVTDWIDGGPLKWLAAHSTPAFDVAFVPSVGAVTAPHGWLVWSERRAPAGRPPAVALRRQGYTVGTPRFVTGMDDSVIAIPFERRAR